MNKHYKVFDQYVSTGDDVIECLKELLITLYGDSVTFKYVNSFGNVIELSNSTFVVKSTISQRVFCFLFCHD